MSPRLYIKDSTATQPWLLDQGLNARTALSFECWRALAIFLQFVFLIHFARASLRKYAATYEKPRHFVYHPHLH